MNQRTIEAVVDTYTGRQIESDAFFSRIASQHEHEAWLFAERRAAQEAIEDGRPTRYLCAMCNQPVRPRGTPGGTITMHFAHVQGSRDCPWRTDLRYTHEQIEAMRYNGQKESELHLELKTFLAEALRAQGLDPKVEEVIKGRGLCRTWRKPDVRVRFGDIKVVFELQISNTFLEVIVARERFYRDNGIFIVWVFPDFNLDPFTAKDIVYANNQHAFVLNAKAREESRERKALVLECFYPSERLNERSLIFKGHHRWSSTLVTLDELVFEPDTHMVYYADHGRFLGRLEQAFANDSLPELLTLALRRQSEFEVDAILRKVLRHLNCLRPLKEDSVSRDRADLYRLAGTLTSFRLGKVIGSRMSNLKSVTNNLLHLSPQYIGPLLAAAIAFDRVGVLKVQSVRRKLRAYRDAGAQPPPCHKYDKLLAELFPEVHAISKEQRGALFNWGPSDRAFKVAVSCGARRPRPR